MLDVIKSFKAKLVEEATPLTKVLDDEAHQPGEAEQEAMEEDKDDDKEQ